MFATEAPGDVFNKLYFEGFGVRIGIETDARVNLREFAEKFKIALAENFLPRKPDEIEYLFEIKVNFEYHFELIKNGATIHTTKAAAFILEHLETQVRITIAEFAVGKVFLHAGVIGWKGKALVLPGRSFFGKTTLVAALTKKGALYFSDEYAVLDEEGNVHPFPKMLSLRGIIDEYTQLDVSVEEVGGQAARRKLPVGMVLFAEYRADAVWNPQRLSVGAGIMELIPHTIPIRSNPEFTLNVLKKIVNRAIISKTQRGEAEVFAEIILDFFETLAV